MSLVRFLEFSLLGRNSEGRRLSFPEHSLEKHQKYSKRRLSRTVDRLLAQSLLQPVIYNLRSSQVDAISSALVWLHRIVSPLVPAIVVRSGSGSEPVARRGGGTLSSDDGDDNADDDEETKIEDETRKLVGRNPPP